MALLQIDSQPDATGNVCRESRLGEAQDELITAWVSVT